MIVITGSRLQALIYGWIGVVALLVLRSTNLPLGLLCAIGGIGLAVVVTRRRVELDHDDVRARSIMGSSSGERDNVEAHLGHRYLTLTFASGKTHRIEVPVEVRPNVRDWVAGGAPTVGAPPAPAPPTG